MPNVQVPFACLVIELVPGVWFCAQVQISAPTLYTVIAVPFLTLIANPWLLHTGTAVFAQLLPLHSRVHYLSIQIHP